MGEGEVIHTRALTAASPVQMANCPAIYDVVGWLGDRRMSLSYAGDALVATAERPTGDIWIMDGLHPPESWWKRMFVHIRISAYAFGLC